MLAKPPGCSGCTLETRGQGFAPGLGPKASKILLVGEALGSQEADQGKPFVGPAGYMLDRVLKRVGLDRSTVRIDNVVHCQPPGDWLAGAPWEAEAISHCSQYLEESLSARPRVVIALGATATKNLLGVPTSSYGEHQNWHGCPTRDPSDRYHVVPTFHPAYLLRGNQSLIGTVAYDIKVGVRIAERGLTRAEASIIVDPSIEWFASWVSSLLLRCSQGDVWLAVDIETDEKQGADEESLEFPSNAAITRINFAHNGTEGVTVPWSGGYIHYIQQLLDSSATKLFWHARYDCPILRSHLCSIGGHVLDFMWAWHVLQSDIPRGLGFVAPFYSDWGAWKHLSSSEPGRYAAIDALQTYRCATGITRDLQAQGQWEAFWRHVYTLDQAVLQPAEEVGLLVDGTRLASFHAELEVKARGILESIHKAVPESVLALHGAWKRPRLEPFTVNYKRGERRITIPYGPENVITGSDGLYYVREPFNPSSPPQILGYMAHRGHQGGRSKKSKTDQPSTDKKTLEALAKKDKFYQLILDYRAVGKVLGTYVEGTERRLRTDGRLHCTFTHAPSTMRLSCVNPNLQNVVADRGGSESLAAGFRSCLVAGPDCRLVEADFNAIEAVEVAWFTGDPAAVHLAKLGVHAYLASHLIGKPANLGWSSRDLGEAFREIKASQKVVYERAKRCVHGTNYGLTPAGMVNNYPEFFTRKEAERVQELYFNLFPKLRPWQDEVRRRASKQGFLGGLDHPFRYKHWFWDVFTYNKKAQEWRLGPDAKRVVAYYPQSTAAGVIYEAFLRLLDPECPNYIGEMYYGKTPLRALIHDSGLCEVPVALVDRLIECLLTEMRRPIPQQPLAWAPGQYLSIGVSVKVGQDWGSMKEVAQATGVAEDTAIPEWQPEDEVISEAVGWA